MSYKANVLKTYRELLELIHCLPAERRAVALEEARSKLREGATESNAFKQSDLLKQLVARVSFLRAATPRSSWRQRALRQPTHYVYRGGELVEGQGEKETRCTFVVAVALNLADAARLIHIVYRYGDSIMSMDEGYRKHRELLKRQHFGRNPPAVNAPF